MLDEEFTDAEVRLLLKRAESDRRRDEAQQRKPRALELQTESKGESTRTPDEIPRGTPAP